MVAPAARKYLMGYCICAEALIVGAFLSSIGREIWRMIKKGGSMADFEAIVVGAGCAGFCRCIRVGPIG